MFRSQKLDPTTDLADLSGKVIIVTGANTGIGYGTAKHLARKGAKVYVGSRSEEKGKKAVAQLKEEGMGSGEVIYLPCDLATPALAKKSAEDFLQLENRLDILGITEMMMVNHIGTFQFTMPLLPLLLKTSEEPDSDVRIVTVTSNGHGMTAAVNPEISFSTLDEFKNRYEHDRVPFFSRYCVSKLANVLFSSALQRRLSSSSIICLSIHPGIVNTSGSTRFRFPIDKLVNFLLSLVAMTPDDGAHTSCFAAGSPIVRQEEEKYKGTYLEPVGKIMKPTDNALRIKLQEGLWKTTEQYLETQGLD
ncbi:hypothetical protein BDZ97DRAFT_1652495 [Flammula alnicola]|nr:hypothetical protein BDZ97DRAFT_1652495 [Flammula alnicola]